MLSNSISLMILFERRPGTPQDSAVRVREEDSEARLRGPTKANACRRLEEGASEVSVEEPWLSEILKNEKSSIKQLPLDLI